MARHTRTQRILGRVGREIKQRPPRIVARTRRQFGPERAEEQRTAILLSKARRRGAKIPRQMNRRAS